MVLLSTCKGAFRDARYGWLPSGLPVHCVCGQGFSVDHALNCPTRGYPTLIDTMSYVTLQLRFYRKFIDVCTEPPATAVG